eukprot:6675324-Prymnesium_polylepis.2
MRVISGGADCSQRLLSLPSHVSCHSSQPCVRLSGELIDFNGFVSSVESTNMSHLRTTIWHLKICRCAAGVAGSRRGWAKSDN